MKRPSTQFYTGDYLKDPKLSMCSPATRGIWMDFLCAMHELDQCGELVGTIEQLTRIGRCKESELVEALKELKSTMAANVTECHGVFTIINRRMNREFKERNDNKLRKRKQRQSEDVPKKSRLPSSSSTSSSTSKHINIKVLDTPEFKAIWKKWKEHCLEAHRKKVGGIQEEMVLLELAKHGHDKAIALIKQAIHKGWASIIFFIRDVDQNEQRKYLNEEGQEIIIPPGYDNPQEYLDLRKEVKEKAKANG